MNPADVDTHLEAALDEPAFSNGTEATRWMSANCALCVHDAGTRDESDTRGCPLVLVTLLGMTPTQFTAGDNTGPENRWVCSEFRREATA